MAALRRSQRCLRRVVGIARCPLVAAPELRRETKGVQHARTLPDDLLVTTDYGETLTAMIGYENIAGTQFHPEKSQATGLKLLENFLKWRP